MENVVNKDHQEHQEPRDLQDQLVLSVYQELMESKDEKAHLDDPETLDLWYI